MERFISKLQNSEVKSNVLTSETKIKIWTDIHKKQSSTSRFKVESLEFRIQSFNV